MQNGDGQLSEFLRRSTQHYHGATSCTSLSNPSEGGLVFGSAASLLLGKLGFRYCGGLSQTVYRVADTLLAALVLLRLYEHLNGESA
jgi:hypothetical protein